jgi:hypothetical protein
MNTYNTKETTPKRSIRHEKIKKTPLRRPIIHKERIDVAWGASRRQTTRENISRHDQDERTWGGKDWHTKKKINKLRKHAN